MAHPKVKIIGNGHDSSLPATIGTWSCGVVQFVSVSSLTLHLAPSAASQPPQEDQVYQNSSARCGSGL